ncbi:hypothetical protein [Micropruina sp.]|uniref:hypothetical protein n=1 Tax=Micropruina sp. TaxID=2737536 RepID=UPI0039E6AA5A
MRIQYSGRLRIFAVIAGCLMATSCAAGTVTISAQDPAFAGLPHELVAEVLESPVAKQRVAGDDEALAKARYQGMVRNYAACRAALAVYQEWMRTGRAAAYPPQPRPSNPASFAEDMDRDIANFRQLARSGDISLLRQELTSDSGCGAWIPAKPGDPSGPTISDVVRGVR